jgi:adenine-specific DNA-methyltransferase
MALSDDALPTLDWPGKAQAMAGADSPAGAAPGEDIGAHGHVFIEGDNLDALKALAPGHTGRVAMIYIDPPYNTGADALYPDALGGHAAWLNMMAPRLVLARRLLADDGVIFISIDGAELAHLTLLCDEIFGEANRIETFAWVRTTTPAALSAKTKKVVEYLLCYERRRGPRRYLGVEKPVRSANAILNQANAVAELTFAADAVTTALPDGLITAGAYGTRSYQVALLDDVLVRDGRFATPLRLRGRFRWTQAYLEAQLAAGVRVHIATRRLIPAYSKASYGREALPNLIDARVGVGSNETATAELRALLGEAMAPLIRRMRPKPVSLLKYLIEAVCADDGLVLDFFAGSGATGQAVLELNAERGARRRFILVQSPQPTGDPACPTIAELARGRLAAVIAGLAGAAPGEDRLVRLITLAAPMDQPANELAGDAFAP